MNTVEISTEEYRELVLKAYKYDKLRATCVAGMPQQRKRYCLILQTKRKN